MISEKKLAANRKNAQKSTGPKTAEGKNKVSQNAVTHGLTSHRPVLDIEDTAEFRTYVNELLDQLDPTNPWEFVFAKRASCQAWRIQRAQSYETLILDKLIKNASQKDKTKPKGTVGADPRVCPDKSATRPPKTKITDYIEVDPSLFGEDDDPKSVLGQALMDDFREHWTLDKIARYETRIENSMIRCLNKFQKVRESKMMNFSSLRQYYREFQPRPQDYQDNVGEASVLHSKSTLTPQESSSPNVGQASSLGSENPNPTVGADLCVCPADQNNPNDNPKPLPPKEEPDQNEQSKPNPYPDRVRRCQSDTEAPSELVLSEVDASVGIDDSIYARIENDPDALPMDSFKHWKILHCAPRGETIDDDTDIPAVPHRPNVPGDGQYVYCENWQHRILDMVQYPWNKRSKLTKPELTELVDPILRGFPDPRQFLWDFGLIKLTEQAIAKRQQLALAS